MKNRRHALKILSCYQYDIALMGEKASAPRYFKLFFKWAGMEAKESCRKDATNFDAILDFMEEYC